MERVGRRRTTQEEWREMENAVHWVFVFALRDIFEGICRLIRR